MLIRSARAFVLTLIMILTSQSFASTPADSAAAIPVSPIHWTDYAHGMETARAENKPMLVFFQRDNCPYCARLKNTALLDTALATYVNSNFVPIRVNTNTTTPVKLADTTITESQLANNQWLVRAVPCMWLLEPDGCRIKKFVGVKACSSVMSSLREVVAHSYGDCPNAPLVTPKPAPVDTTAKAAPPR